MSNDWSGNWLALDTGAYVNSPASPIMSAMIASDPHQYYREANVVNGTETDCVDYNAGGYFLIRISRGFFENSKLVSQFSFATATIGGVYSLRLTHKSLGKYYTLPEALASCGVMLSGFVEDFSGDTASAGWIAMNQALGPHGIQLWHI